jgi:hypothetical protein
VVVAAAVVVVVLVVVVGGGGGARAADRWARCLGFSFFCFMKIALPRAISPLGTRVTRAYDVALGKELFAGPAVPRALCREFPLGTSCAESKELSAERKDLSAEPAILVVCTYMLSKSLENKQSTI